MQDSGFNESFNWGFTNYDNFMFAFVTTFQVVTLEGWSDIMARVIDAWSTAPTVIAFVLLIVLGGIISLNIVLAVISGSLDKIEHEMAEEETEPVASNTTNKHLPKESAFRRNTREIVGSSAYTRFILATILFNTILLSCDHYGISPRFKMALDTGNFITTTVFFIDMVMCNIFYGARVYWR